MDHYATLSGLSGLTQAEVIALSKPRVRMPTELNDEKSKLMPIHIPQAMIDANSIVLNKLFTDFMTTKPPTAAELKYVEGGYIVPTLYLKMKGVSVVGVSLLAKVYSNLEKLTIAAGFPVLRNYASKTDTQTVKEKETYFMRGAKGAVVSNEAITKRLIAKDSINMATMTVGTPPPGYTP